MQLFFTVALGRAGSDGEEDDDDDEFDPAAKKSKGKQKAREKPPSLISENVRANLHTLDEHHDHLLSQSFDASFSATGLGGPLSASQMEAGFQFSDDVFGMHDGLDLGGGDIGDELAKELGEGWGAPVDRDGDDPFALDQRDDLGINFQFEPGQAFGAGPGTDTTPSVRVRTPTYVSGPVVLTRITYSRELERTKVRDDANIALNDCAETLARRRTAGRINHSPLAAFDTRSR